MSWAFRTSRGPRARKTFDATQSSYLATVSKGITSGYAPRKQLIWGQCLNYLEHRSFVLLQIDNLDTKGRVQLKDQLRSMGLALKTPKTHILRKAMQTLGYRSLQDGIVGFVGIAVSHRPLPELQTAIMHIKSQPRVMLLGGRFESYTFTNSGIIDLATNCPTADQLRQDLLTNLVGSSASITSVLTWSQQTLCALLERNTVSPRSS